MLKTINLLDVFFSVIKDICGISLVFMSFSLAKMSLK